MNSVVQKLNTWCIIKTQDAIEDPLDYYHLHQQLITYHVSVLRVGVGCPVAGQRHVKLDDYM